MNYWHIQMNQPLGRKKLKIDSAKMLKENQPVIGTGEWDDYQCKNFKGVNKNGIKLNDIVLVRDGKNPIALCQLLVIILKIKFWKINIKIDIIEKS